MNNKWIKNLFNSRNIRPILKMIGLKRNNRRVMWTSIIGLGVSAAALGFGKNKNKSRSNGNRSIQNMMNNIQRDGNLQNANLAGLAEFAKEIIPEAGKVNKNNHTEDKNFSELKNSNSDSAFSELKNSDPENALSEFIPNEDTKKDEQI